MLKPRTSTKMEALDTPMVSLFGFLLPAFRPLGIIATKCSHNLTRKRYSDQKLYKLLVLFLVNLTFQNINRCRKSLSISAFLVVSDVTTSSDQL